MATISGVLLYTCIQQPTFKYQDKVNKEYKVSVCVSEDEADAWDELFPKQSAKAVKTADFETEYKVEAPFPDQRKQFVITLKRDAQYPDGKPIPEQYRPKVYVKSNSGKLVDVTASKLVANGSVGVVSYEVRSNDYGDFAKLKNVRVDELIEYVQRGAGDDELGEVDDSSGDFDDNQTTTTASEHAEDVVSDAKKTTRGKSTGAGKTKTADVRDLEDDSPF